MRYSLDDLKSIHKIVDSSNYKGVEAAMMIGQGDNPIMLMAQLHGNEPAGLAAISYVMELEKQGSLKRPILAVIGNNLAAKQYFESLDGTRQETRDIYRRGKDKDGKPLEDMNRVPDGFRCVDPTKSAATKRWQELDFLTNNVTGVIDIHSARGNMVCITDSSDDSMLKQSPIRNILVGLSEAIGSATETSTFKTVISQKDNLDFLFGIEAGTHEDENSYLISAQFIEALLYNLGASEVAPERKEDGVFYNYKVENKISFADLEGAPKPGEEFSTTKQFEEMEAIQKGQVVATGNQGTELKAKFDFSVLFITKSRDLFDDEAIGLYPTSDLNTKFCYPCEVEEIKLSF